MPLEDAARQGQRDARRELPALAETPQDWRLPHRCPRGGGLGLQCKAGLIHTDYGRLAAATLFLIRSPS
jgi:hypothetical protein